MKARNGLGLGALLLVATIFFASLMCPPAGEPGAEGPAAPPAQPPAAAWTEEEPPAQPASRARTAEPASYDAVLLRVTDAAGAPILGAEIFLNWADKPSGAAAKRGFSDARGEWRTDRLPHARYTAHAVAEGFFSSAEHLAFSVPAAAPIELTLPLERAARLDGFVFGLDGAAVPNVWLRFRHLDAGTTLLRQADLRGAFSSGPLTGGAWEVAWVEHAAAEPDPRVRWSTVLAPGDRAEVIVTLDRLAPGNEPRAGRAVGIVPSGR